MNLFFATDELFTVNYLIGQGLAILGYLLHFACYCLPKKTQIIVLECVSKAINIASFFFLSSLAGVLANAIIIVRGIAVYVREKTHRQMLWCYVVLMVAFVVSGVFSYNNIWSIFAFIPMLISTTTTWFLGPQGIRIGQIVASVLYLVFQISLLNIAGIALECVVIAICAVTFLLYRKKLKQQAAQEMQE